MILRFALPLAGIAFLAFAATARAADPAKPAPAAAAKVEVPGCAAEREFRACRAGADAAGMEACAQAALQAAEEEMRRVFEAMKPGVVNDQPLLESLSAANMSWRTWMQRDCDSVNADLQGEPAQAGQARACLYRHTLDRAQSLWHRHLSGYRGEIPADCRAQP